MPNCQSDINYRDHHTCKVPPLGGRLGYLNVIKGLNNVNVCLKGWGGGDIVFGLSVCNSVLLAPKN